MTGESLRVALQLKSVIDQHAAVDITDSRGMIVDVNDKFCALFQFSRGDLVGNTYSVMNSGHHPPEFFKVMWSKIASGAVWRGNIKNRAKDGSPRWVDTTIVPLSGSDGDPPRYLAIRTDITERKNAQRVLKDREEQLRLALKGANAAAWQWNIETGEATWSPETYVLHGLDPELDSFLLLRMARKRSSGGSRESRRQRVRCAAERRAGLQLGISCLSANRRGPLALGAGDRRAVFRGRSPSHVRNQSRHHRAEERRHHPAGERGRPAAKPGAPAPRRRRGATDVCGVRLPGELRGGGGKLCEGHGLRALARGRRARSDGCARPPRQACGARGSQARSGEDRRGALGQVPDRRSRVPRHRRRRRSPVDQKRRAVGHRGERSAAAHFRHQPRRDPAGRGAGSPAQGHGKSRRDPVEHSGRILRARCELADHLLQRARGKAARVAACRGCRSPAVRSLPGSPGKYGPRSLQTGHGRAGAPRVRGHGAGPEPLDLLLGLSHARGRVLGLFP